MLSLVHRMVENRIPSVAANRMPVGHSRRESSTPWERLELGTWLDIIATGCGDRIVRRKRLELVSSGFSVLAGLNRRPAVRGARDRHVGGSQGGGPPLPEVMEIGRAGFDAVDELGLERIPAQDEDIDGKPNTEVRAHGRIHRDQCNLECVVEIRLMRHGAIKNRLAVFMLP